MDKASLKTGTPLHAVGRKMANLGRGKRIAYSVGVLLVFAGLSWLAFIQAPEPDRGASFRRPIVFPRKHLRPAVEVSLRAVARMEKGWFFVGDGGLVLRTDERARRWERQVLQIADPQALGRSLEPRPASMPPEPMSKESIRQESLPLKAVAE